jgi:hypothetical protein
MKVDKYIDDGETIEEIYESFERRKKERKIKAIHLVKDPTGKIRYKLSLLLPALINYGKRKYR